MINILYLGALYNKANSPNPYPLVNSFLATPLTYTYILPLSIMKNEDALSPYLIIA